MSSFQECLLNYPQPYPGSFCYWLSPDCETLGLPGLTTYVGETQKVKGFRFSIPTFISIPFCISSKFNYSSLVLIELQLEFPEPVFESPVKYL
jgi:hypothetical protein